MAFQIVCVSLKHRLYGSVYEGNAAFYEGNAAFVQNQIKRWTRDIEGRCKGFPIEDRKAIAYEFDFRNEVLIYEENGVTISSLPAIHSLDGSMSFCFGWGHRSFIFCVDTYSATDH